MKYLIIVAAGLLLPLGSFAEVRVSVNAHVSNQPQYEYTDEGDPWFEDGDERGPEKLSYEFQWSIYGGNRVLRYREVHFHVSNDTWTFGPWMRRDGYCHHSCHLHHQHHYYQRRPSTHHWNREYVRGGHQGGPRYYYVYRPYGHQNRSPREVYRHEYRRDQYEHGNYQGRPNDQQDRRNDQGHSNDWQNDDRNHDNNRRHHQ